MNDLLRLLTLQDFNTRLVLVGAMLLGLTCGVVGVLGVLRRRALMGDALAHAALPGVCVAFLVVGGRSLPALLLGALVFGMIGVVSVTLIRRYTRIKEDAAIALTLAVYFGLGIVLLTSIQRRGAHAADASHAGLDGFIFGKAASMVTQDVFTIAIVSVLVLGAVLVLAKEFRALCFDAAFVQSIGRPVHGLDILLLGLIALATVAALPAVGVVLVVALLTIPPAAARFWTDRFDRMMMISGGLGAGAGAIGTAVSALVPKLSAGPVITLAATALFVLSMVCAPRRGLVPAWLRARRQRSRIATQNLLRALYELQETSAPVSRHALTLKRAWSPAALDALLLRAQRAGLVTPSEPIALTTRGRDEAMRMVRAHRLWELFLIEHASVAPDHVDRDADQLEHVLEPDVLSTLERTLRERGEWPGDSVPRSPHDTAQSSRQGVHA
jgi:manganese/zinc/iron transport system permease protein